MERKRLDVNFFDPAVVEDPYGHYEEIRATGRVVWNELAGGWMVPGFDDCSSMLIDDGQRFMAVPVTPEVLPWFEASTMISVDGPEHRRLRGCLSPLFTRSAIAHWEERIRAVVDRLLQPLLDGDRGFDLIADFTMIPTIIVAEMLGVPEERHADFRRWSNTIVSHLSYGHEDPSARTALLGAAGELNDYLRQEIDRRSVERPDDLLSAMVGMAEEGRMDADEVRAAAVLLLVAGYDTTAKVLSNTVVALEMHPAQRQMVAEDLELVPAAVEEVLRWRGTVQAIPRVAARDMVFADAEVAAGDMLYALIGAAGRDPNRWENPLCFDVKRELKANYGFGWGSHLCLGAPLARLEVRVAIEQLLRRAPEFSLRDVELGPSFFVRGPDRGFLDVTVAA